MAKLKLRDIVWGGRIKRKWQSKVWAIARQVATHSGTKYSGSTVSSSQRMYLEFLDGGVSETRGFFDASSGMRFHGKRAQAYVLYRLGLSAEALMKGFEVPSIEELEKELRKTKRRARGHGRSHKGACSCPNSPASGPLKQI
jgi:hypothetical protein